MENLCLKDAQAIFTIAAIVAGGLFFIWKIIAGWLIANLDISIEEIRQAKDVSTDWIAIKVILKKGNTDSIWIKDVVARISDATNYETLSTVKFNEFHSFNINHGQICLAPSNAKTRKYAIAPGETFQFGKVAAVPFDRPIIIEILFYGERPFWKNGAQWRATCAVLPIENRVIPNIAT